MFFIDTRNPCGWLNKKDDERKAWRKEWRNYLHPHGLPLLHRWLPPSCWQKYINQDTLALKFLPQQPLSQTLYWVIERRIYMTNGVNRLGFWFTSLSKHSVFTPGNQSINLFPAHEPINNPVWISSGVHQWPLVIIKQWILKLSFSFQRLTVKPARLRNWLVSHSKIK